MESSRGFATLGGSSHFASPLRQEVEQGPDPSVRPRSVDRVTMDDQPRIGVGSIVSRGDEILLVRRASVHGWGTWSTPGGHLDHGETLEACAAREMSDLGWFSRDELPNLLFT